MVALLLSVAICATVMAQDAQPKQLVLFTNANIFDGMSDNLATGMSVLVEGNKIAKIAKSIPAPAGAKVIDGKGHTLMPGLADTHVHLAFSSMNQLQMFVGDPGYNFIHQTKDARGYLMRGVTVVRDMGGNVFGLKKAIDEGMVPGPRIYPSGAPLSQTAGHGDFRFPNQQHPLFGGAIPEFEKQGQGYIVDGVPEVLTAARENLRRGASQIKLFTGGGYASPADPLLGNQFTFDEIKAAVDTAKDWGTYVTIHAYHPSSINRAIEAGVMDVGHGQLLDEATLRKMADKGVFLSTQPFTVCHEDQLDDFSNSKLAQVCKGTTFVYEAAKKIPKLKVTYGTDLFFVPEAMLEESVEQMERLLKWYTPYEILKMATGTAGELFAMSGMRNPYTEGPIGVVKEGAYADLLLVEGNPLEDLKAVTNTGNLRIIMKDGKIYKNTIN